MEIIIYHESGLESFEKRRQCRKLCRLYKIFDIQSPKYLLEAIPTLDRIYITRNAINIPPFNVKHNLFENSFFPSTILVWSQLYLTIRS